MVMRCRTGTLACPLSKRNRHRHRRPLPRLRRDLERSAKALGAIAHTGDAAAAVFAPLCRRREPAAVVLYGDAEASLLHAGDERHVARVGVLGGVVERLFQNEVGLAALLRS